MMLLWFSRPIFADVEVSDRVVSLGRDQQATFEWQWISAPDIVAAYDRRKRIFLYSIATYEDFSGTPRVTETCQEIRVVGDPNRRAAGQPPLPGEEIFDIRTVGEQNRAE